MELNKAIEICKETLKWKKREPPYDSEQRPPYDAIEYGTALDALIEHAEDDEGVITVHTERCTDEERLEIVKAIVEMLNDKFPHLARKIIYS